ncbi:MAG: hypothetical protein NVSMB47_05950 [Polyangiales bacterium]
MVLVALFALILGNPARARADAAPTSSTEWQRLVAILEYLESDYPAAVGGHDPGELGEQRGLAADAIAGARKLGPPAAPFVARLESIGARVTRAEDARGVRADCIALVEDLVAAGGLSRSPRTPPDLDAGRALFTANCAACHGADGAATTEIAARLDPRPASFVDPERVGKLTPYRAFNAVTFGTKGTAMPSFATLDERARWDVAFYVLALRHRDAAIGCDKAEARLTLEQLATSSDDALARGHGAAAVPCLRTSIPRVDEESRLLVARDDVEEAIRRIDLGRFDDARQSLIDAYLQGIEPVEAALRGRDPEVVVALEASFARTRSAIEARAPSAAADARALLATIDRARRGGGARSTPASVFWLSLLIVVREGFEATVVIAALLAVLKKMQQRDRARLVHLGWIAALVVGAIAFAFGHRLLAGANRERIEAVFALIAVAMLLHAALWLNAKTTTRKSMGALRDRMQDAVGRRSAIALFAIAFTAVFRESFETAVFLQGLSIDAPRAAGWGAVSGLVALGALVFAVGRLGVRLPMRALFDASTVLLLVTAVVLVGKGVHALQEVGWAPVHPVAFGRLDLLGVYPDLIGLAAQAALACAPIAWIVARRRAHVAALIHDGDARGPRPT